MLSTLQRATHVRRSLPRDAENFVTGTTSRPIILAAGNRGAHQVPVCDLAHHLAELLDRVLTPDDELQRARALAFVLALALLHSLRGGGLDAVTAHLPWREPLVMACGSILQSTDGVVSPALLGMAALDVALSLTSAGIAFDIATDRPNLLEATSSELIERRKVAKRAQKAVSASSRLGRSVAMSEAIPAVVSESATSSAAMLRSAGETTPSVDCRMPPQAMTRGSRQGR
jgi:hypothetical protein